MVDVESRLRRDRYLYYSGLVLLLVGIPGLLFGSWFHDIFRVYMIGEAFDAFGWINQMFALLGLILGILGIILLIISLKGGLISDTISTEGGGEAQ